MIYFCADFHIHCWKKFATINALGVNSRLAEQIETIRDFSNQLTKEDVVIFLGDFLHAQGSYVDRDTYHAAYSIFEEISDNCKEFIIIPGNHDVVKNSIKILRPLKKIAVIVDTPMVYREKGDSFYCIPYTSKREEFVGMLKYLGQHGGKKILCSHVGVLGATVGITEYLVKEPILPEDILSHVDLAVLGHYHRQQVIQKDIHYVGSPYQIDFSEMGIEKGYMSWNGTSLEFSKLHGPNFWVVPINHPDEHTRFLKNRNPNDYYKLIIRTKKIPEDQLKFESNVVVVKEYKIRSKRRIQTVAGDPSELIKYYVDNVTTDLDKARIKREASQIWKEKNSGN